MYKPIIAGSLMRLHQEKDFSYLLKRRPSFGIKELNVETKVVKLGLSIYILR